MFDGKRGSINRATLASIERQMTTRPGATARNSFETLRRCSKKSSNSTATAADAPTGELPLLTLAKQTSLLALRQQLEVEIPTLRGELTLYDGEMLPNLRFSRELATQQIALAEKALELVTTAAKRVRERYAAGDG